MAQRILKHSPLQVTVDLPSDWEQEVEEESTDVFWNNDDEGGTLRMAVMEYESEAEVTDEDLRDIVESEEDAQQSELTDGGYMSSSEDDSVEDDVAIHNWTWTLTKRIESNRVAVIVCTYTVETNLMTLPEVKEEIAMVERAVRELTVESS